MVQGAYNVLISSCVLNIVANEWYRVFRPEANSALTCLQKFTFSKDSRDLDADLNKVPLPRNLFEGAEDA